MQTIRSFFSTSYCAYDKSKCDPCVLRWSENRDNSVNGSSGTLGSVGFARPTYYVIDQTCPCGCGAEQPIIAPRFWGKRRPISHLRTHLEDLDVTLVTTLEIFLHLSDRFPFLFVHILPSVDHRDDVFMRHTGESQVVSRVKAHDLAPTIHLLPGWIGFVLGGRGEERGEVVVESLP